MESEKSEREQLARLVVFYAHAVIGQWALGELMYVFRGHLLPEEWGSETCDAVQAFLASVQEPLEKVSDLTCLLEEAIGIYGLRVRPDIPAGAASPLAWVHIESLKNYLERLLASSPDWLSTIGAK